MTRARSYSTALVLSSEKLHIPSAAPEDVERLIQEATLAVELRWANRTLETLDAREERAGA